MKIKINILPIIFILTIFITMAFSNKVIHMSKILQFSSLYPFTIIAIYSTKYNRRIKKAIMLSISFKFLISIINEIYPRLLSPDGKLTNGKMFHEMAVQIHSLSIPEIFSVVNNGREYWVSLIALMYKFLGVNNLYIVYFNILFSIIISLYIYKIVQIIKGNKVSNVPYVALLFSLFFPGTLILSTVELREIIIVMFMIISVYHYILFQWERHSFDLFISILFAIISAVFHVSSIILLPVYFAFSLSNIKTVISSTIIGIGLLISLNFIIYNTPLFLNKAAPFLKAIKQENYNFKSIYEDYMYGGVGKKTYYRSNHHNIIIRSTHDILIFFAFPYIPNPFYKFYFFNGYLFLIGFYWIIKDKIYKRNKYYTFIFVAFISILLLFAFSSSALPQISRHKMKLVPLLVILISDRLYDIYIKFKK